jgi:diadenylate cyclase
MINLLELNNWKPAIEIAVLWFGIYHILLFFEGTRALQVIRGIIILLIVFLLAQSMQLMVLDWLMRNFLNISITAILIIFHPEIRQALARLGQQNIFKPALRDEELDAIFKEIGKATEALCKNKVGALIAIEKNNSLSEYARNGVKMDSIVSAELIQNIFTPNSLLHDGGVIIQNGRISAAGCIFPLTTNQDLSRMFGTRHRAALGLSEETDSICIVISEERHDISLVYESRLYKDLSKDEMLAKIKEILKIETV